MPLLAISTDCMSTSVAKIFTWRRMFCSSIASRNMMATEYASSPVEQPATHTRMVSRSLVRARMS